MSYRTNPEVLCKKIGRGYFLLSTRKVWGECPFVLEVNETAAFFWDMLKKGLSREEIIHISLERYNTSEIEASDDLNVFICQLIDYHYLEKAN